MMDKFEKMLLKLTTLITIIVALITYFIDPKISIGFVFGCMCAQVSFMMLSVQLSTMLKAQHFNAVWFGVVYVVRLLCIGLPLLLSALKPEKSNIWAVFAGFMTHKLLIYILGFFMKEDSSGN